MVTHVGHAGYAKRCTARNGGNDAETETKMSSTQLALFSTPKLVAAFRAFHEANPRVYELFRQFAEQIIERGHRRYSADAVLHRIRWHTSIETQSDDGLKINDHYSAFYARLYMRDHPEHNTLFALRRSVADWGIGA